MTIPDMAILQRSVEGRAGAKGEGGQDIVTQTSQPVPTVVSGARGASVDVEAPKAEGLVNSEYTCQLGARLFLR